MSFDPYHILGVRKSATEEEIRRAYRNLARRYHPDMNRSSEGEEHFKLLAQAYSVLSDGNRRTLFDEFGEASLVIGFDSARARASEPKSSGRPRTDPGQPVRRADDTGPPSPDVYSVLEIDLATAVRGGEVKVASPSGAKVVVDLPAGVQSGHRIRLRGRGGRGLQGGLPGDLYLDVHVLPHPFFHRDGHDLILELPVTVEEVWRGAQIEIPTLEGWVRLTVPAGSRGGERLRLRGKGLLAGAGLRGDLFVHLCVRLPEELETAHRSLERLAGLYNGNIRAGLRF